jgi:hypothetical protein
MRWERQLLSFLFAGWLSACSPALDWREYRPPEGGFAVLLPQKPGQSRRSLDTPAGVVVMYMYASRVGEHVLAAGFADFAAPPDAVLLDAMRDALLRNIVGRIESERAVEAGGFTGREIVARGTLGSGERAAPGMLRARLLVRGNRYVQLISIGTAGGLGDADVDMFLTSFKPG